MKWRERAKGFLKIVLNKDFCAIWGTNKPIIKVMCKSMVWVIVTESTHDIFYVRNITIMFSQKRSKTPLKTLYFTILWNIRKYHIDFNLNVGKILVTVLDVKLKIYAMPSYGRSHYQPYFLQDGLYVHQTWPRVIYGFGVTSKIKFIEDS